MPKITKRTVDAMARPAEGEVYLWDTEIKGFGVRLLPSGVATYLLKYRNAEGRQRKLALGRVGTLTPDEARIEAKSKAAEIAKGGDPAEVRAKARDITTVSELCDQFLKWCETRKERPLKPNTLASHRSNIEKHIKPDIGTRSIKALDRQDVRRLQERIAAGKAAKKREGRGGIVTGGPGAASRAIAVLSAVYEYGRGEGIIERNPVADVKKLAPRKRERYLTEAEIKGLGQSMRDAAAEGEAAVGIAAVRFLLLSGFRRREALGLRDEYIDRKARCARLPDTKTGAQFRALGKTAFEALDGAPSNDDWIFPAMKGDGAFVGLPKVLARLAKRANVNGVSAHVLRHTFATFAVELGYSELVIAGLLGHAAHGVTQRYAHRPDRALILAADEISAHIAALLDGVSDAKVVRFADRNSKKIATGDRN